MKILGKQLAKQQFLRKNGPECQKTVLNENSVVRLDIDSLQANDGDV